MPDAWRNLNSSPQQAVAKPLPLLQAKGRHYTSHSGEQRPCISPYLDITDDGSYVEASDTSSVEGYPPSDGPGAAEFSSDHMQYCFSRYRSYRPENNSYQPYSGGPRRQCE